ncbi:MAG: hypothetical protein WD250_00305 [Egibacteraceae bacterium]
MSTAVRTILGGERGSVPLALLVVIIMAGLTSMLYARTTAEQRSVQRDGAFTTVVHAAEAGVEEAAFELNSNLIVGDSATGSGTANGYDYTWSATRADETGPWVVTSTGTGPNDASRTVVAELADRPIFDTSLATHLGVNFQGGNSADSYSSATQQRCPGPSPQCFGIVASNGNIDMGSSGSGANYADRVHVHDWANPDNNGPERCGPSASVYCDENNDPQHRYNVDEPLDIGVGVPLVQDLLDGCSSFPSWTASDNVTGTGDPAAATLAPSDPESDLRVGGDYYCFSELLFDVKTELPSSVTADDGLVIVVRDRIKIDGHVEVNCTGCSSGFPADPNMPAARRLQIFTLADDQPAQGNNVLAAVQVRQHAKLGAAVYAPNASCGNQQSNAQVEIYGSLVCKTVLNQGGWQFHYDEDMASGLRTGDYHVHSWREE